ncbi:MAG TPA: tRNA epoxyqueuosine(34) reductase QueG [Gemmatimonadales bacterium]|nr:tRNA epoxyqueuosine(34) reductase QueG [Gemmatimonadales bacterium]
MNAVSLAAAAKAAAQDLGYEACGITDLAESQAGAALTRWLDRGLHGEMRYMERQAPVRREPTRAWPQARSAIVVLDNYYQPHAEPAPGRGRVARYALGDDYHSVMSAKLEQLAARLVAVAGGGQFRAYVDAGPLPERELARRAGLGWIGKNTMLIRPAVGSFTFIGVLLTDLELAPDEPFEADRCGTCRRCLDACPTGAFLEPRVLDATRCISYLTIEARGAIPEPLKPLVGDWLFGCDVCQDVCPWNVRFATETGESRYLTRPASDWPTLVEIVAMTERAFDEAFAETSLERAGRSGLARNATVLLENAQARGAAECPAA